MLLGDFVLRCFLWRKNSALTVVLRFTGYTTRTSIASYNPGPKSGRQSAKATCDTSLKMGSHYSSFLTPTPPPLPKQCWKIGYILDAWGWEGRGRQEDHMLAKVQSVPRLLIRIVAPNYLFKYYGSVLLLPAVISLTLPPHLATSKLLHSLTSTPSPPKKIQPEAYYRTCVSNFTSYPLPCHV